MSTRLKTSRSWNESSDALTKKGIDFPAGEKCPQCPFWADRNRWTGELLPEAKKRLKSSGVKHARQESITDQPVQTRIGVAWYRPVQWEALREVSSDRDKMEAAYDEWRKDAEAGFQRLRGMGMLIEKVDVDVQELVEWCKSRNVEVNGESRADFVAEKIRQKYQESDEKGI